MSTHQYDIIKRLLTIRQRFENGQHLNCSDIAADYHISTKTAHRDLNMLREFFKLNLIFDASARRFYLATSLPQKDCPHATVRCTHCGHQMERGK